ncbi:hypothetical protein K438DRAFT_1801857 [Mycena galopus ATCC 62051]|nr:hypothetical protein K438DRAFT_1801857 [Mycena galopus ATCC 62051]
MFVAMSFYRLIPFLRRNLCYPICILQRMLQRKLSEICFSYFFLCLHLLNQWDARRLSHAI